jgi:hypothetical protein
MKTTCLLLLPLLILLAPITVQAQFTYSTNVDGSICALSTNADGSLNIAAYTGPPWAGDIPANFRGMTVTTIGADAFADCSSLTNVTIPGSVANIGSAAFYYCTSLTSVTIPPGVTNIGYDAFEGCASLTHVDMPGGLTSLGTRSFADCPSLAGVTIPGSVTSVGNYAFGLCPSLSNATIASGVTSIRQAAFYCCSHLSNVTIPASVTNIGSYAFGFCTSLTNLTIPAAVTSIGDYSCQGCSSLCSVYFLGDAPAADSTVFSSAPKATVYYLPGTKGWSNSFGSVPTAPWFLPNPLILTNGPGFGLPGNVFGFMISWAPDTCVVVEACTNLASPAWLPLQTNVLTNGWCFFSEPLQAAGGGRFYRVSSMGPED